MVGSQELTEKPELAAGSDRARDHDDVTLAEGRARSSRSR